MITMALRIGGSNPVNVTIGKNAPGTASAPVCNLPRKGKGKGKGKRPHNNK